MTPLIVLFTAMSLQTGLPAGLLSSLCWVESKHKINAIHHDDGNADSLGVCQIKLETAKGLGFKGTTKDLMKPENNVLYAAKYLSKQIKRYHGSVARGVIAYNLGNARGRWKSVYQLKVYTHWRGKYGI